MANLSKRTFLALYNYLAVRDLEFNPRNVFEQGAKIYMAPQIGAAAIHQIALYLCDHFTEKQMNEWVKNWLSRYGVPKPYARAAVLAVYYKYHANGPV